jgi:hypothetical protein
MGKAYRVLGTTNDVTQCELCGRVELKGTVVMMPLDADGNEDGDAGYFGTACAARMAGWTVREVNAGVKAAAREERERAAQERARKDAADRERTAERNAAIALWPPPASRRWASPVSRTRR